MPAVAPHPGVVRGRMINCRKQFKGLAEIWEKQDNTRRSILWDGMLLKWPDADSVGVATYRAAKLNVELLEPLFEHWVKVMPKPRATSVEVIQPQVSLLHA